MGRKSHGRKRNIPSPYYMGRMAPSDQGKPKSELDRTLVKSIWTGFNTIASWVCSLHVRAHVGKIFLTIKNGIVDWKKQVPVARERKEGNTEKTIRQRRVRQEHSHSEGPMKQIMQTFTSWGIAAKLVTLFLVFGLLPMAAVGYMGYSAGQEMRNTAGLRFQTDAQTIADKIDRNLFERYGDPKVFGLNRIVSERYNWYQAGDDNEIASAMNEYVATAGIYYLTLLVDPQGDVIAANTKDAEGNPIDTAFLYKTNFSESPWFQAMKAEEYTTKMPFTAAGNDVSTGTFIEDLHIDEHVKTVYPGDDGLTLGFSAPVYANGDLIGYWSNRVKFSLVEKMVQDSYQELKASGYPHAEITLLDSEGRVIVDYDPETAGALDVTHDFDNVLMKLNLAEKGVSSAQAAVAGESGSQEAYHARKEIWQIGGYTHLKGALGFPGMNWSVLVRVPSEEAAPAAETFQTNLMITALICMSLIVMLGLWIGRRSAGSLIHVGEIAKKAADGDLSRRVQISSNDELGDMGTALNAMFDNVARVVGEVRQAAEHVSTGSAEIMQGNEDLSERTSQQASALEETSASMEQMTSTIKQNADNSKQANQLAVAAREVAEKGGSVTERAVEAMGEINRSSKKIADIINVIDEIAFQTNLLALNAAVEAARAGEQGRGFAVVASEVRNLAGRSATAAKEIKALINESVQKVGDGSDLVNQSGQTLEEIVNSVKRVTDIISEISAASQEQASGIDQVNKAVMQMDQSTQQNAALVEETTSASQSMRQQAAELLGQVEFFKMSADEIQEERLSSNDTSGKAANLQSKTPSVVPSAPKKAEAKKPTASVQPPKSTEPEPAGIASGNGHDRRQRDDDFFEEF